MAEVKERICDTPSFQATPLQRPCSPFEESNDGLDLDFNGKKSESLHATFWRVLCGSI